MLLLYQQKQSIAINLIINAIKAEIVKEECIYVRYNCS